mmetsp:Transcript_45898/g.96128  ORF Transcript_45898/g.96128 Transcript_45898/m.96128 type:complete len:90 (-) Transcript_45898:165-434(-)
MPVLQPLSRPPLSKRRHNLFNLNSRHSHRRRAAKENSVILSNIMLQDEQISLQPPVWGNCSNISHSIYDCERVALPPPRPEQQSNLRET